MLLYEDSRETMADQLTDEEKASILAEFDAIDDHEAGVVSLEEIAALQNLK